MFFKIINVKLKIVYYKILIIQIYVYNVYQDIIYTQIKLVVNVPYHMLFKVIIVFYVVLIIVVNVYIFNEHNNK